MATPISITVAALVRDGLVLLVHRNPSALDMHAFLVTRLEGEPVNAAPEEHDDLRWFQPSDLTDLKIAHPASLPSIRPPSRSQLTSR